MLAPRLTVLLPLLRGVLPGDVALDAIVNDTDSGLDLLLRPHRRVTLTIEANQKLVAFAQAADLARLSWGDRANPDPIVTRRAPRLDYGEVSVEPSEVKKMMRSPVVSDWQFAHVHAIRSSRAGHTSSSPSSHTKRIWR